MCVNMQPLIKNTVDDIESRYEEKLMISYEIQRQQLLFRTLLYIHYFYFEMSVDNDVFLTINYYLHVHIVCLAILVY